MNKVEVNLNVLDVCVENRICCQIYSRLSHQKIGKLGKESQAPLVTGSI